MIHTAPLAAIFKLRERSGSAGVAPSRLQQVQKTDRKSETVKRFWSGATLISKRSGSAGVAPSRFAESAEQTCHEQDSRAVSERSDRK
jgi:hypothetical protein